MNVVPNTPIKSTESAAQSADAKGSAKSRSGDAKSSDGGFMSLLKHMAMASSRTGDDAEAAAAEDGGEGAWKTATKALAQTLSAADEDGAGMLDAQNTDEDPAGQRGAAQMLNPATSDAQQSVSTVVASPLMKELTERIASASETGQAGDADAARRTAQPQAGVVDTGAALPSEGGEDDLFSQFAVKPEQLGNTPKTGAKGKVDGEDDAATLKAGPVKILREETHFAPSMRLSPMQQISDAMGQALAKPASTASNSAMSDLAGATTSKAGPTVKVLEIQLQPMELGSVKVTLKIVGDNLEVSVRAANQQTVEILEKDRQLLDRMLRSAGYKADVVTIQAAADDRPAFQVLSSSNTSSGNAGWQLGGQGNGQGSAGASSGGEQQAGKNGDQTGDNASETGGSAGNGNDEPGSGKPSDGNAVYL